MEMGMIGLGKMGANMTSRLVKGGHRMVVFDRNPEAAKNSVSAGAVPSESLENLISKLALPRAIWVMVPAGNPTEETLRSLAGGLEPGDILIDGGNSNFKDTIRRAEELRDKNLHMVDVGTSGGIWGLTEGYSMMIGGDKVAVERLRPIFETLAPAPDKGWGHVGPSGSGHFVKMVHNGIEYGMMESYAEGFSLLKRKDEFGLDLHQISEIWQHGSVVRSWLLDLTARALAENPDLKDIAPFVADSGEGRWTVFETIDLDVPAPVITLSLIQRLRSRDKDSFSDKFLAALRNQFGGHEIKREG
jgi:6-phosphogluconate dehydrogenase